MTSVSHQVVGLIDIPTDVSCSADAIVRDCLGNSSSAKDRDRWIITGRLQSCPPLELLRLPADLPQLQHDLDQLFESFLFDSE